MVETRSNRFGAFRAIAVSTYCGLTACSGLPGEPTEFSVFPVSRITNAVATGANRPVVAEREPAADHGELRFVVVPRGQAVSGMVQARRNSEHAAIAPDRAVHAKKQKAHAVKVSAPVATVGDASAELVPLN